MAHALFLVVGFMIGFYVLGPVLLYVAKKITARKFDVLPKYKVDEEVMSKGSCGHCEDNKCGEKD